MNSLNNAQSKGYTLVVIHTNLPGKKMGTILVSKTLKTHLSELLSGGVNQDVIAGLEKMYETPWMPMGLGGTTAEVMEDLSKRLNMIHTDQELDAVLDAVDAGVRLLTGQRGMMMASLDVWKDINIPTLTKRYINRQHSHQEHIERVKIGDYARSKPTNK